jgi:hypothetical protein
MRALATLILSALLTVPAIVGGAVVVDALVDAQSAPTHYTKVLTVDNTANVEVVYSSALRHSVARCVNKTTGVSLFIVESSDANTNDGLGPYCDTCIGNATLPPLGKAFLRTSAGTASVACDFTESPVQASGGGGGGMSMGTADARFLKLAADNDPLTGRLDLLTANSCNAVSIGGTSSGGFAIDSTTGAILWCRGGNAFFSTTATTIGVGISAVQLVSQDGSAAAPGFAFVNDLNTGARRSAADTAHLVAGAADSLTWTGSDVSIFSERAKRGPVTYKNADESVTSSTTLQDDDELTVTLAVGTYRYEAVLQVVLAGATSGFKYALHNGTATFVAAGFRKTDIAYFEDNTHLVGAADAATTDFSAAAGTVKIVIHGTIEVTGGGTFKVQFAQKTSDAAAVTMKRGSYLSAERLE